MTNGPACETAITPTQKRAIESLFENLPQAYAERVAMMQSLRRDFYAELAKRLQPALNAYVKMLPQGTWEERKALTAWINQTMRHTGLALVCPRTGAAAILLSDVNGSGSRQIMRYRFETKSHSGKRIRSSTYIELPDMELVQAPRRVENLSREYKERGSRDHSR